LLKKNEQKLLERETEFYKLYLKTTKAKSLLARTKAMFGNEVDMVVDQLDNQLDNIDKIEEDRKRENVFGKIDKLVPELLATMAEEIKL
jgi:CRISPR/Cas system CSM-associated protein Csm2 small subunit